MAQEVQVLQESIPMEQVHQVRSISLEVGLDDYLFQEFSEYILTNILV
jgi:hypothetical protein